MKKIRFLSQAVALSSSSPGRQTRVQLLRAGTFSDPRYGRFEISPAMLGAMKQNFELGTYGQDIFIDVAHNPDNGAAAKVVALHVDGQRLLADVEWTDFGLNAVRQRGFRYLSAEYSEDWLNNETQQNHGPVLLGGALTIRPVIKRMEPIQLSEASDFPTLVDHSLHAAWRLEARKTMDKFLQELRAKLTSLSLSEADIEIIIKAATAAGQPLTGDEAALAGLLDSFETTGRTLAEARAAGQAGTLTLSVNTPAPSGLDATGLRELVTKILSEQAAASRQLQEKLEANQRVFLDAVNAAEGLDATVKKELAEMVTLVTAEMTPEQAKALAEGQVGLANRFAAQARLAGMGYPRSGSARITLGSDNTVRELQEIVDQRMGIAATPEAQRFATTGGQLPVANKMLAEQALARFDLEHGRDLADEHQRIKQLAAGSGAVSDVSVPRIWERTVIRESLYMLVGLQFVDSGVTPAFANSYPIPYSYRDTSAAGVSSARVYEGGAIQRAGVIQTSEEAYNIPSKLSFELSDELRYLANGDLLNWDAVAENARNAQRIIGEDLEQVIFNEVLQSSDEYGAVAVSNENLELQADDSKRVFVLAHFPVVRPRKYFDLQGAQVGSTVNPVTVTYNSVALSEYDGTGTQSAGTYYVLDYNQGEIYLVNQAGTIQTPANGTAYTISYSYATNSYAFDIDVGSADIDAHWDTFLYRFGTRKTVLEDPPRSHMANFSVMSGAFRDQVEQAKQFNNLTSRPGTDLQANGNLGRIKDVPGFRSYAPGLYLGDVRTVIGERGVTRFRVAKPWEMGEMENQKDSNGKFTGKKQAYGDQFSVCHTPTQLKRAYTSMVLYSSSGRVARVNP